MFFSILVHLHCGNLAVTEDERVQILDIENDILGLPSMYRAFMVQCKGIKVRFEILEVASAYLAFSTLLF